MFEFWLVWYVCACLISLLPPFMVGGGARCMTCFVSLLCVLDAEPELPLSCVPDAIAAVAARLITLLVSSQCSRLSRLASDLWLFSVLPPLE